MSGKRDALEAVNRMISEVHRRPELWNRQHPQHHNRSVLDRHWETVAAGLGMTSEYYHDLHMRNVRSYLPTARNIPYSFLRRADA